ncbi:imidazole glycerol phosphate synthase subunit HisF [Paramagnetospirillum kuznetsovii]|uniref:Imidazole glycerol phosphate synthase subunit HisF n=1 Tax=Paramagnetospirillum kuznetsovii TaxID=2053833 RepID=A0A364P2I7_9PROT|nr:imidazole glycerol phosphate synthase cyclase subunit [Paramagnetospirillum kuznetsovii]RAU23562.1 imidazole glycerol phosphate synthase subunit HisF [Paramagnetospirillum kuznetsovii]
MAHLRLIARLDIKAPNLIKGIHLEGVRVVGNPQTFAQRYYDQGVDELLYVDAVASLYGRNSLTDLVRHTAENVFIPITVGGGLRSVDDVRAMLRAGADKVAINTAAVARPDLIREVAETFGSQCMVVSIQAKRQTDGRWEALTDGGREHSKLDAIHWARQAQDLGAGEILLTSVDQEGTQKGFDLALTRAVAEAVTIPVIASGGMGKLDHLDAVVGEGKADAVAMAHVLHYDKLSLDAIRAHARNSGITVRHDG